MSSALIGATGFVGSTLLRQRSFEHLFHSRNIGELADRDYDLVVCAGAPAQKWMANKDPAGDRERLASLRGALGKVRCGRMVLISTVDVFAVPVGVDEESVPDRGKVAPYGAHRLDLEELVRSRFHDALIVRLPGLVGPGLRKNAVFDLHHRNNVTALDSRARLQFYPMLQLWADVSTAMRHGLRLVHLTAEPVSIAEVAEEAFGEKLEHIALGVPAAYDFQSRHAALFGAAGRYQYDRRESLMAIRAYRQSEAARAGNGQA